MHVKNNHRSILLAGMASIMATLGCTSPPTHTDEGALVGGLTGAGVGALIGQASGHTGAGAAIGAGVGALTGAAVGHGVDKDEARNRAAIEAQIGRQLAGAVTVDDVITMTHSNVSEEVIINHIRAHGVRAPLQPADLITLQQQGVSDRVIQTMQALPVGPPGQPVLVQGAPPPPYVGPYPYPYYGPYYRGYYRPRPRIGWGVSFGR